MGLFDDRPWRFSDYFDYLAHELIKVFEKFEKMKYIEDKDEMRKLAEDILKDIDRILIGCGEDGIDTTITEKTREEIYERVRNEVKGMIKTLKRIGYLYFGERKKQVSSRNHGTDIFD